MNTAILSLAAGRNTPDGIARRLGIPRMTVKRAIRFLDEMPFDSWTFTPSRRITIDEIKCAICRDFEISRADLTGPFRSVPLARARHVAMFLARELARQSFPRIGAAFGGRDHTTVVYACRAVRYRMVFDPDLSQRVVALARALDDGVALPSWRRLGPAIAAVQAIAEALR